MLVPTLVFFSNMENEAPGPLREGGKLEWFLGWLREVFLPGQAKDPLSSQLLELMRVNPDRNIFSINVELTSTFLLYRGLVHY